MTQTDLVDRLAAHKTIGSAPREELAWLASNGTLRTLNTGDVLTPKGVRVEGMFIILSGRIAIYVDRGAGPHKTMEWRSGDVTGMLPYSRLVSPPSDTLAEEPTEVFAIHRDHLQSMIRDCHAITSILVHNMVDRARLFTTSYLQDEKMLSLGKLSAGLAHELNNPASAIERSAAVLEQRLQEHDSAARALGAANLTTTQLAAAEALGSACIASQATGVRSPIEQAEREDAIAEWLDDHGVDTSIAEALADTEVTLDTLNRVPDAVQGPALAVVLRAAAARCSVRTLAAEISDAATRISTLVQAIKGFTHMDQAQVAEPVDLLQGLTNTVVVLKSKARAKSATVAIDVEPNLPRVRGFIGELNQVWANLIDNALDAIPESGRVDVLANRERQGVVIRVVDNGGGIPEEMVSRIFDPFFTTKAVGKGTGLGLDIVRRLVQHNDGAIYVESQPGRTEFRVVLPAVETEVAGARR